MKTWVVEFRISVILHVRAPDKEIAEALAEDSLSRLHVTDAWKDCVTLWDDWAGIEDVAEIEVD